MSGLSEDQEQAALFAWAQANACRIPELECLYAIPNGGTRHPAEAVKFKRTGVKSGVPDICLPVARKNFHALYIEMKRTSLRPRRPSSKGGVSDEQVSWLVRLSLEGHAVRVCYGADEAISTIIRYLSGILV